MVQGALAPAHVMAPKFLSLINLWANGLEYFGGMPFFVVSNLLLLTLAALHLTTWKLKNGGKNNTLYCWRAFMGTSTSQFYVDFVF